MAFATTDDGVKLHYEETGSGAPIIFVHEFAGDHRSWEQQLQHFGRRYRAIAYAARGYPPSDVPENPSSYSQNRAADDILSRARSSQDRQGACLRPLDGRFRDAAFRLPPSVARVVIVRGRLRLWLRTGYAGEISRRGRCGGGVTAGRWHGCLCRALCLRADPRAVRGKGPARFRGVQEALAEHSALGAANTQLGCQKERPSLYDLQKEMAGLIVPTLILTGDEDWPCLAPGLLMKRTIPSAALAVMPNCGHTINLEAPAMFNGILGDFIAQVDAGRWPMRDPRAMSASITGIR